MNCVDLSLPPSDADLLTDVVRDALAALPESQAINISAVVASTLRDCPDTITAAQIFEEVLRQAVSAGLAIDFDSSS